ncbi:hypothetical protein Ppa06_35380 [Planomonospora parontospora subsp. parontospora]|uniref:Uncharacterized protein n=2 Tax=Planomonospora parontospora TaxID=58119 RepID=A0AA37F4X7_9ACTN|nr:hypothetical protein GCM10010126_33080 [Planomonospora parontospora]GII09740.1 hypothetical protein Ppa06_35380 [Planomonospora parontospora subsp. parontospora]
MPRRPARRRSPRSGSRYQELLEDGLLADGLQQMRQGEGRPWKQIKTEWGSKNSELTTGED